MRVLDAIDEYHALLTPEVAEEANHTMRQLQRERGTFFGERALCTVLRPHFYSRPKWDSFKESLEMLLSAFVTAHRACCEQDSYRALLGLTPNEEKMFQYDTCRETPWTSSRLDTFWIADQEAVKCVEYNSETPAGIGYNDILADVFDVLEPMKRFREKYHLQGMRVLHPLYEAIVQAYRDWGGREQPQIGILDWAEVPTRNEHEITRQYFERYGYKGILGDPREVEYRDGALWLGDFRIDIVYKRVLYSELLDRMGVENPILHAVRDRAVYITNSPACKLMAKKASLAFLSDERNARLFSREQLKAIDECVPWTRVVSDRKTTYNERDVDLLEFIERYQDELVLKPNDEYGGKGVILGWDCTADIWKETIKIALNDPFVVQQRVDVAQRPFPAWIEGQLNISQRYVDADPYVFHGAQVHGCLTRLSSAPLLNVTAGTGSVVPAYIIEEKE